MTPTPRSVASIAADLRSLGVAPGDIVMVHASLRRVGPVDGGALGLIAARDLVRFATRWLERHLGR